MGIYIPGVSMPKDGECIVVYGDGEVWHHGKRIAKVGTALEADYISREAVVKKFTERLQSISTEYIRKIADEIPPADVRPVVPGEWIALDIYKGMGNYKCSVCNQESYVPECMGEPMYNFCPNCGAKMGGAYG